MKKLFTTLIILSSTASVYAYTETLSLQVFNVLGVLIRFIAFILQVISSILPFPVLVILFCVLFSVVVFYTVKFFMVKNELDKKEKYAKTVGYIVSILSVLFLYSVLRLTFWSFSVSNSQSSSVVSLFNIFILPVTYLCLFFRYVFVFNEEKNSRTITIKGMRNSVIIFFLLILSYVSILFIFKPQEQPTIIIPDMNLHEGIRSTTSVPVVPQ